LKFAIWKRSTNKCIIKWNLESGTWNLESGIWNLESGIWNLESGMIMQFEIWKLQIGKELPARVADLQPLLFLSIF